MEYALIILSTVLFGGQFIALNAYQEKNGKTFRSVLLFTLLFSLIGMLLFACLRGFSIGFSLYTLLYSGLAALLQLILQFAGILALSRGRVEIYTLFNVSGGMTVTYIFGISFFQEQIKIAHIIGLLLIIFCLIIPMIFDHKEKRKFDFIFYVLCFVVFLSNGFFGVINKIHIVSLKALSINEYMFYLYLWIATISSIILSISLFKKDNGFKKMIKPYPIIFALLYGLLNSAGMAMQYAFADTLPASILFPLSNGGCILFGLIIGCIAYKKKPKLQDIIQMLISISGMVLFIF